MQSDRTKRQDAAAMERWRAMLMVDIPEVYTSELLNQELEQEFPAENASPTFKVTPCFAAIDSNDSGRTAVLFARRCPAQWDAETFDRLQRNQQRYQKLQLTSGRVQCNIGCLGLTVLYSPVGVPISADVIFLHGLGGHAIGSWTTESGVHWPSELLGPDLESCRILSFGYDSRLRGDSLARLVDHAQSFLTSLSPMRNTKEMQERPLILCGHSYGGTIIARIMYSLQHDSQEHRGSKSLYEAIKCLVFFGAPHHGIALQPLQSIFGGEGAQAKREIAKDLRPGSDALEYLRSTLVDCAKHMQIVSCYEMWRSTGRVYAESESAKLGVPNEILIPIEADHRNVNKFQNRRDSGYAMLKKALVDVLSGGAAQPHHPNTLQPPLNRALEGHTGWVCAVAFSQDREYLASVSRDRTVRVWELRVPRSQPRILKGHTDTVSAVTFSPDGKKLITGSRDKTIKIWDWNEQQARAPKTLEGHTETVCHLTCPESRDLVASGSLDGTVRLWNCKTGDLLGEFVGHGASVQAVAFAPDGNLLASGSAVGEIRLWNVADRQLHKMLPKVEQAITVLSFVPDGSMVVSGSPDDNVRLWNIKKESVVGQWKGGGEGVEALHVTGHEPLNIAALGTCGKEPDPKRSKDVVFSGTISSDGSIAAVACRDGRVRIYEMPPERDSIRDPDGYVWSRTFFYPRN